MMRAPVYRHIESTSTLVGLSLNGFVALLATAFAAIQLLDVGASLGLIVVAYLALRLMGRGRPPQYWQHLVLWHARQRRTGGRLSAAARARTPEFPFGPYLIRAEDRPGSASSIGCRSVQSS